MLAVGPTLADQSVFPLTTSIAKPLIGPAVPTNLEYQGSQGLVAGEQGNGTISGHVWHDHNADGVWDEGESGLAGWTVFLDLNENGERDEYSATFSSADVPQPLLDLETVESTLDISGVLGTIIDVRVTLDITHTWSSDLTATLISPQGVEVLLFANVGGSGQNFENTTFDSQSANFIWFGTAPFAGTYQPMGNLGDLAGHDVGGTWKLQVSDAAFGDTGTLNSWSLAIDYSEPEATTDVDGAYSFPDLPAGTYVVAEFVPSGWAQSHPAPQAGLAGSAAQPVFPVPLPPLTTTASTAPFYIDALFHEESTAEPEPQTEFSGPMIGLAEFRTDPRFEGIDGSGYATVIIDTGINRSHPFFGPDTNGDGIADRIVYSWDFADNDSDVSDANGHGTHVTSIVASQSPTHTGMAPGADIIVLKVYRDDGAGSFAYIESALQWVVANLATYNIVSVNMSLGDGGNHGASTSLYGLGDELLALAAAGVVVAASAGNGFYTHNSVQGVTYPAADPNTLAVGAVWKGDLGGPFNWASGARDITTGQDRIVSFSQRHATLLDVFAPGATIRGAAKSGTGTVVMSGTSQAAPHVTGIAVLAQQLAEQTLGRRLTPTEFRDLLASSAVTIHDGDDEHDNVTNTGLDFLRVDMLALAEAILDLEVPPATVGPGMHIVVLGAGEVETGVNFGNYEQGQTIPVADAGGPYAVLEGESLQLDGAAFDFGSWDDLTFGWDLNDDGVFEDAFGPAPLLSWADLLELGIEQGPASWQIRLRVTNLSNEELISPPAVLDVINAPPSAEHGGPYEIFEGESLVLDGAGYDPSPADVLHFSWDLNGDGLFDDAEGAAPTLTWAQLNTLGIVDGPSQWSVRLRVSDGSGGIAHSETTTLTVHNSGPIVTVLGPGAAHLGHNQTFTLLAADPSPLDQAQDTFTFYIDWNGDGTVDQTLVGPSGTIVERSFSQPGTVPINIWATDPLGDAGPVAQQLFGVYRVGVFNGDLVWEGSDGHDIVYFEQVGPQSVEVFTLQVQGFELLATATFHDVTGRVRAYGHGGSDRLDAGLLETISVYMEGGRHRDTLIGGNADDELHGDFPGARGDGAEGNDWIEGRGGNDTLYGDGLEGGADTILGGTGNNLIYGDGGDGLEGRGDSLIGGPGNDTIFGHTGSDFISGGGAGDNILIGGRDGSEGDDTIVGGSGNDILSGGEKNDSLVGGGGRNIIIGGDGEDTIVGGPGEDLIIADRSIYERDLLALMAIRDEWTSANDFATRVAHISGAQPGGLNGTYVLEPGTTLFDDELVDRILAGNGPDWVLYSFFEDMFLDPESEDEETDTFGTAL